MKKDYAIIKGNLINPISYKSYEYLENAYIIFSNSSGKIIEYGKDNGDLSKDNDNYENIDYEDNFLLPSFLDLHTHIPQFPIRGIGDSSLLYWLNNFVKDAEIRFCDRKYAINIINKFFDSLISSGTITFCAYSNGSIESTDLIFEIAKKKGIRLICGNTLGDLGGFYCKDFNTDEILTRTEELIKKWHGYNDQLYFSMVPRFALFCSEYLMKRIAGIYRDYNGLYIQTHLAENRNEISEVLNLHKEYSSYTDIYKGTGLLTPDTLLAHCIYLNENEVSSISENRSSVVHCPTSNRFLKSGIMPLKKYIKKGLKIGLGTDIGGGYNTSIIKEMREAIEQSKTLSILKDADCTISPENGLYMATLGAAEAISLQDRTGSISPGKYADLVVIKNNAEFLSSVRSILPDIIYNDSNILKVYSMGREIYSL